MTKKTIKKLEILMRNSITGDTQPVYFDIKDIPVAQKWANYLLEDYLSEDNKSVIEKNFMFHGWVNTDSSNNRDFKYLCDELNFHIHQINSHCKENNYDYFIDLWFSPDSITREKMNAIHHHFEILQGQVWNISEWYKMFDEPRKYSVRQLNHFCHEIEALERAYESLNSEQPSTNTSLILPMYPPIRHDMSLEEGDWDYFEYRWPKFGEIRIHYSQIGKTHWEVFFDEDGDIYDENITGHRYLSGEFDIVFNIIPDQDHTVWDKFQTWLMEGQINMKDKSLALGQCFFGEINRDNFPDMEDIDIMKQLYQFDDLWEIALYDDTEEIGRKRYDYTWRDLYESEKKKLYVETVKEHV